MATLTGNTIASTYTGLLSVSGAVGADTVEAVTDGAGTSTSLSLSQQRATITLGSGAADDFIVDGTTLVVEGDNNRVGIGTAAPVADLDILGAAGSHSGNLKFTEVAGDVSTTRISIMPYGTDNSTINFDAYLNDAESAWVSSDAESNFQIKKNSDKLSFNWDANIAVDSAIAWNTAMSIKNDGDVTFGASTSNVNIRTAGSDTFIDPGTDASNANIFVSGASSGDFSSEAGHLIIQARTHTSVDRDIIFASSTGGGNTAARMVIVGAGDVTVSTGNLVIGTNGKGIDFSATSDATGMSSEILDDYEEGTWTPAYDSGLTSAAFASASGKYTKIGRHVFCSGFFNAGAHASNANKFHVTGLPFATAAGHYGAISLSQYSINLDDVSAYLGDARSLFYFVYDTGSGSTADVTNASTISKTCSFSLHYIT
jgi:hypothetical protein